MLQSVFTNARERLEHEGNIPTPQDSEEEDQDDGDEGNDLDQTATSSATLHHAQGDDTMDGADDGEFVTLTSLACAVNGLDPSRFYGETLPKRICVLNIDAFLTASL